MPMTDEQCLHKVSFLVGRDLEGFGDLTPVETAALCQSFLKDKSEERWPEVSQRDAAAAHLREVMEGCAEGEYRIGNYSELGVLWDLLVLLEIVPNHGLTMWTRPKRVSIPDPTGGGISPVGAQL